MIKLCGENKIGLWELIKDVWSNVSYQIAVFFILSDPINNDV